MCTGHCCNVTINQSCVCTVPYSETVLRYKTFVDKAFHDCSFTFRGLLLYSNSTQRFQYRGLNFLWMGFNLQSGSPQNIIAIQYSECTVHALLYRIAGNSVIRP